MSKHTFSVTTQTLSFLSRRLVFLGVRLESVWNIEKKRARIRGMRVKRTGVQTNKYFQIVRHDGYREVCEHVKTVVVGVR